MADALFYFDISCPYSYIAAQRIEAIQRWSGGIIHWLPVFQQQLRELQEDYHLPADSADQSQSQSQSDGRPPRSSVPEARRALEAADLRQEAQRYGIKLSYPPSHPIRTVDCGRFICAFPHDVRPRLALALFNAYWRDHSNVQSQAVLLRIGRNLGLRERLTFAVDAGVFSDVDLHNQLSRNIEQAHEHGAFATPAFYMPGRQKLFYGQDRLPLLEAELASLTSGKPLDRVPSLDRLLPRTLRTPPEARRRTCYLWGDFSSPWTALAFSQLERLRRDAGDSVSIEFKPVYLGALFKQIGTPLVPLDVVTRKERDYRKLDMHHWAAFWSALNSQEYPPLPPIQLRWPDTFPVRSTLALRVALIEPRASAAIFRAAWTDNVRIDDAGQLTGVLDAAGLPGTLLVRMAASEEDERGKEARERLRRHTDEAVKLGIVGAPTWQVGKHLVFGQDRIAVVQDLIAGWRPEVSQLIATVGTYPCAPSRTPSLSWSSPFVRRHDYRL